MAMQSSTKVNSAWPSLRGRAMSTGDGYAASVMHGIETASYA